MVYSWSRPTEPTIVSRPKSYSNLKVHYGPKRHFKQCKISLKYRSELHYSNAITIKSLKNKKTLLNIKTWLNKTFKTFYMYTCDVIHHLVLYLQSHDRHVMMYWYSRGPTVAVLVLKPSALMNTASHNRIISHLTMMSHFTQATEIPTMNFTDQAIKLTQIHLVKGCQNEDSGKLKYHKTIASNY